MRGFDLAAPFYFVRELQFAQGTRVTVWQDDQVGEDSGPAGRAAIAPVDDPAAQDVPAAVVPAAVVPAAAGAGDRADRAAARREFPRNQP